MHTRPFFSANSCAGILRQLCAATLLAVATAACGATLRPALPPAVPASAPNPAQWEADIAQFEAADRISQPVPGGVVFVGSSSIRMWPNLQADFPGVSVLQRGFGGSELADAVYFAPRIVLKYRPRLIVLYAGDNDIANGKSPQTVFADYTNFVSLVKRSLPETRIAFISIKPSASRWQLVDKMREANALIRNYIARDPRQIYVDVFTPMLGPNGLPRDELFLEDKLHMTPAGYAIWRNLLTPIVQSP
jgi:lysophospholipase L1-like esterase